MNWRNIKLVFLRELRDQLRDRRTLFMVAVLPLLMYPLMGTTYMQLSQFKTTHKASVVLVGAEQLEGLPGIPKLVHGDAFAREWFDAPAASDLLEVKTAQRGQDEELNRKLQAGEVDAVVMFADDFAERLREVQQQIEQLGDRKVKEIGRIASIPRPVIRYNMAEDTSRLAYDRVRSVLRNWRDEVMRRNLAAGNVPQELVMPIGIDSQDVAGHEQVRAGLWATLLPFVVFIWALTGAFYPAVDLCAGEKERGTLETLLASPAQRGEIVWGKLLTVMLFSMATALLNLLSLGFTGQVFLGSIESVTGPGSGLGMPPLASLAWVLLALPPIAALFSALSIACASFAKSTKEGQYYFMPLFMGAMPLMLMPLSPGVELNLGNAFVPVMGVVLLLRSLIEGHYAEAIRYIVPVTGITLVCCLLAVKWAVYQFNQESVLFREGERFSVGQWLRKLVREPKVLPTAGMAVACIGLILCCKFFADLAVLRLQSQLPLKQFYLVSLLVSQACVLGPPLLMTLLLVVKKSQALFGQQFRAWHLLLGASLAVLYHPISFFTGGLIQRLFPPAAEVVKQLADSQQVLSTVSPVLLVLLMGVLPGVCEEIAFRGFILGGLRRAIRGGWAVLISALAFGVVHGLLQQSINATILGLLLGYLVLRFGGIGPSLAFHITNNSLLALFTHYHLQISAWAQKSGWRSGVVLEDGGDVSGYHPAVVAIAAAALCVCLVFVERSRPRAATMSDSAQPF
ncbi:MAG: CPBP family intramembrane metalloprotease [Planctomycetales bacterium]|nr:CPBP family intramembrane metalloprotease [Planctomycetales bacterium]